MNTSFHMARVTMAVLAICGLTTGCADSGTDKSATVLLFFSTNNWGACGSLTVDIDVNSASAVPARRHDRSVDCALNLALQANGCELSINELNDGDILQVHVGGCDIPPIAAVFQCDFTQADIPMLEAAMTTHCSCAEDPVCSYNTRCNVFPAICISQNPQPGACENCENGTDDDHNGMVDCSDPNCAYTEYCYFGGSTITCSDSTTTTSVSESATPETPKP